MRLSARDCMARGWCNLWANGRLVPMMMLQGLIVFALTVLGMAAPWVSLGKDRLPVLEEMGDPVAAEAAIEGILAALIGGGWELVTGLAVLLVLWTLAFLVFCYFQAGIYGVLAAGDRQAPPGAGRDRRFFATFSLHDFHGWGKRFFWPFFWYVNLFMVLMTATLLPLVLAAAVSGWATGGGAPAWGPGSALALVFGGLLLSGLLAVIVGVWYQVGLADLARPESGARAATRRGLRVVLRRPGAVAILTLVYLGTALAVSAAFMPLSFLLQGLLADDIMAYLTWSLVLSLIQGFVLLVPVLILAASMIALVRSEGRTPDSGRMRPAEAA